MPLMGWFQIPIYHHYSPQEVVEIQKEVGEVLPRYRSLLGQAWDDTALSSFAHRSGEDGFLGDTPLLKTYITSQVETYLKEVKASATDVRLISSWINVCPNGGYQHFHNHPQSDVSGVYYYQTTGKDGLTVFRSDSSSLRNTYWLEYRDVKYQPKEGMLVLFPSFLEHKVTVNETNSERISVAFNIRLHR
jgi:uncharacterized protein (TIGR02466 family)